MLGQVQFSVGILEEVTFKQKQEGSEGMQISELQAEAGDSAEPHTGSLPDMSKNCKEDKAA